jgi:LAO/AO transport system ATPase
MPDDLLQRFRRGDRRALSRLLSLLARGERVEEVLGHLGPGAKPCPVVAITGSAGVGKSTLIGKLIEKLRAAGRRVAVLACDPQSPLSGGALLGDRFRMPVPADDDGVFIRSLATASGQGAVADNLDALVRLLQAFGFDIVLIETVGAGQGDTAVRDLADGLVLLLQPEAGDDLQWEKAGLLEVADVVVIHKADLPGADRVEAQVRSLLNLPGCREVPVLPVSSRTEEGVAELCRMIANVPAGRTPREAGARSLLRIAQRRLAQRFPREAERLQPLLERWRRRELSDAQAADELLVLLARPRDEAVSS